MRRSRDKEKKREKGSERRGEKKKREKESEKRGRREVKIQKDKKKTLLTWIHSLLSLSKGYIVRHKTSL